ncbi:protein SGT1 homolog [Oppia nitens]|uniref:protein SGT1 homolog n=1 Tax=Oppia nitens TaxID=1686743 RepID=UPI0023DB4B4F|nr:protein SGT1 homolog [Oppia nitens]
MSTNTTQVNNTTDKKKGPKNWDQIVKDIEAEEEEENKKGEGSVDELFKQIYANGSEEVRRAMNKSFQESDGTVLSTNWSEVSKSKVDVKPPEGCEHKEWN